MKSISIERMTKTLGGTGTPTRCIIAGVSIYTIWWPIAIHYIATQCND